MTPAQEAKDYAAQHGFTIITLGRRYIINHQESPYDTFVAEVGGYPAALNAMKRYVQQQTESSALEQARETGNVGAIVDDVNATKVEILDSGRHWLALSPAIIRGNWHVRIEYAQPDQNGDSVFHASRESRYEAIKFVRQHLSSAQGRHVISQSVTYGA